ncbi:MAG: MtaA/CmuA family methyltransferase [Methanobacteriota archaeon]|nr:MAG: MtaA/CmuA family methyltransferase [Euryarchaeota archaeon]
MDSRERVLRTLEGEAVDRPPCFSGMGNVTVHGLKKAGVRFAEAHGDAKKMAAAAASTYKLFGFECAVAPFDLGLEAEALGCELNFYDDGSERILYPTVKTKILKFGEELNVPEGLAERGRVPMVKEAIGLLKDDIGDEVAVGSYVLGPYTLAGQVMDLNDLLKNSFKKPDEVERILRSLSTAIVTIAAELKEAGADYITVREMGAPADVISPRMFSSMVLGPLKETIKGIDGPVILHICGNTNPIVELMVEAGASAIAVDQKNDVAATREKLGPTAVILGNIDPYNTLVKGTPDEVKAAVKGVIQSGVNGVAPGCDIWPEAPAENMEALVKATEGYEPN